MGAALQVSINRYLRCTCKIGDDLRTIYAQLVYSNRQDIALTLLTGFKVWLAHNCQTEEDHINIKIVTALLLYNAYTLHNMMEICVTNNNKLKIHPRGMATLKKLLLCKIFCKDLNSSNNRIQLHVETLIPQNKCDFIQLENVRSTFYVARTTNV